VAVKPGRPVTAEVAFNLDLKELGHGYPDR
jgi:hypothetical protein